MKIKSIKTEVKNIALKKPFITALRRVDGVEFVRVGIENNNGIINYGEAPATKAITGEDIEIILKSISNIKESLLHQSPQNALKILHNSKIGSSAKAALDMALFSFINTKKNSSNLTLQTDITISLKETDEMFEDAKDALSKGMKILKLKFDSDIKHAIQTTKKISQLDVKIIVDANQAWSLKNTLKYIDNIKNIDIELIEQPVKASALNDLKIITNYSTIPILADESVFTLEDAKKIVESKSADMINIKLMKCGGVTKAIEILDYAREKNIKCMLGSMLEGPISINAALYIAMDYCDTIQYIDLDSPLLYKDNSNELEFHFDGYNIKRINA